MISIVFTILLLFGLIPMLYLGKGAQAATVLLSGAGDAITTCLALAGSFAVFCGLIEILKRAGAVNALSRLVRRPLRALLGKDAREQAMDDVTLNLTCNMLGLGNAATPAGVRAACALADGPRATNALCVFLVINASSVQLFPASVVALRAAAGSAFPARIVLSSLAATLISSLVGISLCKVVEKFRWN